jgi:hypothetical protein
MNRMLRPLIAGSLIVAAGSVAAGCADNNATLFVFGVLAPTAPTCDVIADPAQLVLGSGTLDVALRTNYEARLLVGNQYTPRGAKQQLKAETTRITLTGAEITLKDGATDKIITCKNQAHCGEFSVYGSGFANPSKSEDPGWGIIFAQLIPNAVGESFRNTLTAPGTVNLVATVKVFGTTLGNQDVESGGFSFPIQLCKGCLVDYSTVDSTGACPARKEGDSIPVPCDEGQDEAVDCRACRGLVDLCSCAPGGSCADPAAP